MNTEEFLSDDFLKQFKTGEQLNDFLASIQKRAIEKMLEGELDDHLGYDKHQQTDSSNRRNGYGKKKIKTGYGQMDIEVPRDRDASFNPMLVPQARKHSGGPGRSNGVNVCQGHECFRHTGARKGCV